VKSESHSPELEYLMSAQKFKDSFHMYRISLEQTSKDMNDGTISYAAGVQELSEAVSFMDIVLDDFKDVSMPENSDVQQAATELIDASTILISSFQEENDLIATNGSWSASYGTQHYEAQDKANKEFDESSQRIDELEQHFLNLKG